MRLPEIELKELKDPGLLDFMDFVRVILNQGKYNVRIVTTIPTGSAEDGELLLYTDSVSTRRLYAYFNDAWRYINFDG